MDNSGESSIFYWGAEIDASGVKALSADLDEIKAKLFGTAEVTAAVTAKAKELGSVLGTVAQQPQPTISASVKSAGPAAGIATGALPGREELQRQAEAFVADLSAKLGIAFDKLAKVVVDEKIPAMGGYTAKGKFSREDQEITLSRSAMSKEGDFRATLAHELGHALDFALGGGKYASVGGTNPDVQAIVESFKKMATARGDLEGKKANYSEYFNRPQELFANAFKEHLTGKTPSDEIAKLLASANLPKAAVSPIATQTASPIAASQFQVGASGLREISQMLTDVNAKTGNLGDVSGRMAKQQTGAWAAISEAIKKAAGNLLGFAAIATGASAGLTGIVLVGMRGTAEMERLGFSFQMLTREVANIFTPAIHAVIDTVQRVLVSFRSLTGDQQALVRNFVGAAGAALAFATVAGMIAPKLEMIASAARALWAGMAANPLLGVAAALGAVLVGTEKGREALAGMFDAVKPVLGAVMDIAGSLMRAVSPIAERLAEIVGVLASALKPVLDVVAGALSFVAAIFQEMQGTIGFLADALGAAAVAFVALKAATMGYAAAASFTSAATAAMATTSGVLAGILPALRAGIIAVNAALWANPLLAIAGAVGLIVAGIAALFGSGRREERRHEERQQLTPRAGGWESFEQTWKALQSEMMKQDIPRMQLREQQRTNQHLQQIAQNTGGRPLGGAAVPAVGN